MATHLAAICTSKGELKVEARTTPKCGSKEVIVDVKAVALNIVDSYMHAQGVFIKQYPAILGSDVAGTIVEAGPEVPAYLKPGTRVTAFATAFYSGGDPDYGAFQQRVLVDASSVSPIPENTEFNEAATLPMAVGVAMSAWDTIGIPLDTKYSPQDKQGLLVWGAGTSVGTMAVQSAKLMGFTVIATASAENHDYLRSLGADKLFDYHDDGVEKDIVAAVANEALNLRHCFFAFGSLSSCQHILKQLNSHQVGMIAHAPPLLPDAPVVEGIDVKFIQLSSDPQQRVARSAAWFNSWLKNHLENGTIRPSPKVQIVGEGLETIGESLTLLMEKGPKCAKFVIEM